MSLREAERIATAQAWRAMGWEDPDLPPLNCPDCGQPTENHKMVPCDRAPDCGRRSCRGCKGANGVPEGTTCNACKAKEE